MAWNSPPDYQFPSYPLSQHQQSCGDVEEEKTHEAQQDAVLLPDNQYSLQASASSSSLATYKTEPAVVFENNVAGAMLLQPLSLPQLEDAAELRQLLPPQTGAFPDTTFLRPNQQQLSQIEHGQLQPQFSARRAEPCIGKSYVSSVPVFSDFYEPLPLLPQSDFRPCMGYQFQADFPVVHNTLPPSFSSPPQQPVVPLMEVPKLSPERRKLCSEDGCKNQARAFGRCKRHGGSKRCSSPGCDKSVQSRGLCIRHGGGSRCQESGCTRASQSFGKCKLHGGGRPCSVAGCKKRAHLKRLCRKHGGGIKCCITGCEKWAQSHGMCMKHVKEVLPPDET
ncbi:hypothetical protein PHYPSEUDO_001900 [Phytophthora pseudosyringae]|uniref:WRKY19-like zinc finger domain-containing protein n=1 Tax=Phytophthora pseudosyringae TaxID=221518 RepID=A0A8T1WEM8_9STRA|nr:hypothetical protein PHYPSEUDO_001900 [Phytophthora pseudosyringae]